jgi:hypothetical protein
MNLFDMAIRKTFLPVVLVGLGFFLFFMFMGTGASEAVEQKFIGGSKCMGCHKAQYDVWVDKPHAKAFASLEADEAQNPRCLSCHTTGHGQPAKDTAKLNSVQCEACHGAGSLFRNPKFMNKMVFKKDPEAAIENLMELGLVSTPDEKVCLTCHNEKSPHYKGFDFDDYAARIKHWE